MIVGAGTTTVSMAPLRQLVFYRTAPDALEIFDDKLLPVRHTVLCPSHMVIKIRGGAEISGARPDKFSIMDLSLWVRYFLGGKSKNRQNMTVLDHIRRF